MLRVISLSILLITRALVTNAQIIEYEIDSLFNTGGLMYRGYVNDFLILENDDIMVSYSAYGFGTSTPLSMIGSEGNFLYNLTDDGPNGPKKLAHYNGHFLFYVNMIRWIDLNYNHFNLLFEFSKDIYSGPLPLIADELLVIPEENHILVAGRFFTDSTLIGTSTSHLGLRHLCMIDSAGAPVPDFPMIRCNDPVQAYINKISKLSTGEYIITGTFYEVEGHFSPKIAKLNSDFSVDTTFVSPFLTVGDGVGIRLVDSQDRIWVGYATGTIFAEFPDYPSNLARIMPDGSVDTTYLAPELITYGGADLENPVWTHSGAAEVLEDSDGTFILGSSFQEVNGEPQNRLIKITDSGEIIENAFNGIGPDAATWDGWTPSNGIAAPRITVMRKLPDGKILIGGQFSSFGGEPYSCMVRLQPSGYVGTKNALTKNELIIYPNPAKDSFTIKIPDHTAEFLQVEIYDLIGRIILTSTVHHSYNIVHIDNLLSGTYLVKASNSNKIYSGKLVVQ